MKRVLFGIFAHPDDEAFCVSGTLIKETRSGTELHLVCVTEGEYGQNPDKHADLAAIRKREWEQSGQLLGASSLTQLSYPDGGLDNSLYLEIAEKIKAKVAAVLDEITEPADLQFMTFTPGGITGHLDHIAVSMITTFVFQSLKASSPKNVQNVGLRYFCICKSDMPEPNTGWLYMPAGHPDDQVDETIDVGDVFDQKLQVMATHHTQREDAALIKRRRGDGLKKECFYYAKD